MSAFWVETLKWIVASLVLLAVGIAVLSSCVALATSLKATMLWAVVVRGRKWSRVRLNAAEHEELRQRRGTWPYWAIDLDGLIGTGAHAATPKQILLLALEHERMAVLSFRREEEDAAARGVLGYWGSKRGSQ